MEHATLGGEAWTDERGSAVVVLPAHLQGLKSSTSTSCTRPNRLSPRSDSRAHGVSTVYRMKADGSEEEPITSDPGRAA